MWSQRLLTAQHDVCGSSEFEQPEHKAAAAKEREQEFISRREPRIAEVATSSREAHHAPRSSPRLDLLLTGLRVLLVDDCLDNQVLFHRALTAAGAETDLASNGAEAIELSCLAQYDAIIMDMRMPVIDGYSATVAIRQAGYRGPVIALTAHANPGEETRCRASGCSHFFLKPIDRRGLIAAVHGAVQSSLCQSSD